MRRLIIFAFLLCIYPLAETAAQDFVYNSKGRRDPFVPFAGAEASYEPKEIGNVSTIEEVALEGIVYDEKKGSVAVINGALLREGDKVGIFTVQRIERKKVMLGFEEKTYELILGDKKGG